MYVPDESTISRWLSGKRDLPTELKAYYNSKHKQDLRNDIELNLLPEMTDCKKAIDEIGKIIASDFTISTDKKNSLLNCNSEVDFLTEVIYFAINRNVEVKNKNSVSVKNIILNCVVPRPCKYFCGRDYEIENVHTLLCENDKVFLQGIAGIGKSELAKFYALKHKNNYTNILYLAYSGNLKNDIAYMHFVDDKQNENIDVLFDRHFRFLQALENDTLIIVDNFDTETDLHEIMELRCKVLFTSRYNHASETTLNLTEITDNETLLNIADKLYSYTYDYAEIVLQIAETVHHHTFAFEMAMRLLEKGIDTPEVLLHKLQTENIKLNSTDKIKTNKDGNTQKAVYYEHIRTLFSMQKLSSDKIKTMKCCAFISANGIDARLFAQLSNLENLNIINNLDEYGLIKFVGGRISIHPIIQEITIAENKPSVKNCRKFLYNIRQRCLRFGEDMQDYKDFFMLIENILDYIEKDNLRAYLLFLKDTFQCMEKYRYEYGMRMVVDEMECVIPKIIMLFPEDTALMLDCKATVEELFNKNIIKALEYANKGVAVIQKITKKNALLVSNINANLGRLYAMADDYDNALKYMDYALKILDEYKIHNHDLFVQICNYASMLCGYGVTSGSLRMLEHFTDKMNNPNTQLDYAMLLEMTGNIYNSTNSNDKAFEYYKKAFQIYPKHLDTALLEEKAKEIGINKQLLIEAKTE
jgi:tetratricopeptide (TPR) repeat protein